MSRFSLLNCVAILCALIIFAVGIASTVVNWYSWNEDDQYYPVTAGTTGTGLVTYQSKTTYWNTAGITQINRPNGAVSTNTFTEYSNNNKGVFQIFQLVMAFILIALILSAVIGFFLLVCFADVVRNKLLFLLGMNILRIGLLIVAILVLCSLIISFLCFLGITGALNDDIPNCTYGYCSRFADSTKTTSATPVTFVDASGNSVTTTATMSTRWGPVEGWFLNVGMIPFAVFLCIIVVINKFPIPVDSMTIGEAL